MYLEHESSDLILLISLLFTFFFRCTSFTNSIKLFFLIVQFRNYHVD